MRFIYFVLLIFNYVNNNNINNNQEKKINELRGDYDLSQNLKLSGIDSRQDYSCNNTEIMEQLHLNLSKKRLLDFLNNDKISVEIKLNKISQSTWLLIDRGNNNYIHDSDFTKDDFD